MNSEVENTSGRTVTACFLTYIIDELTGNTCVIDANIGSGWRTLLSSIEDQTVDSVIVGLRVGLSKDPVIFRVVEVTDNSLIGHINHSSRIRRWCQTTDRTKICKLSLKRLYFTEE